MELTETQIERYSRQIILPAIGGRGQRRLLETTIVLIGDAATARSAALYLTAAGVGHLDIAAPTGTDLMSTVNELKALNPDTMITMRGLDATPCHASVFVCADAPPAATEHANRAALHGHVALIVGVSGRHPRIALYAGHGREWPCAACDPHGLIQRTPDAPRHRRGARIVRRKKPPETIHRTREGSGQSEASAGVLGSLLALEAIKTTLGLGHLQPGRALHYEPETLTIAESRITKNPGCRACALVPSDA